jgi:hypothetical protein
VQKIGGKGAVCRQNTPFPPVVRGFREKSPAPKEDARKKPLFFEKIAFFSFPFRKKVLENRIIRLIFAGLYEKNPLRLSGMLCNGPAGRL